MFFLISATKKWANYTLNSKFIKIVLYFNAEIKIIDFFLIFINLDLIFLKINNIIVEI